MEIQAVKKIDMHIHVAQANGLYASEAGPEFLSADTILEIYDRLGVESGVILPFGAFGDIRKYANLYADLSARSGFNALSRDPEFAYQFIEEFHDRLFFGTDGRYKGILLERVAG